MFKSNNKKFQLLFYSKDLTLSESECLSTLRNLKKLSVSYGKNGKDGKCFYNKKDGYYYVAVKIDKFRKHLPIVLSYRTTQRALAKLDKLGYIVKHNKGAYIQIETTDPVQSTKNSSAQIGIAHYAKKGRSNKKDITNNKHTNTRVNTRTSAFGKFRPMDSLSKWYDNVKPIGLTEDTIMKIAKFSNTYNKSAYKITGLINEARNAIADKYNVSRKVWHYESNQNIITGLGSKIYKLFTYIMDPGYTKATLSNFAGWFVNSLKSFFKQAFGIKKDIATVAPKVKERPRNYKQVAREKKIIKRYDNEGKHLHPTSNNEIKHVKELMKQTNEASKKRRINLSNKEPKSNNVYNNKPVKDPKWNAFVNSLFPAK